MKKTVTAILCSIFVVILGITEASAQVGGSTASGGTAFGIDGNNSGWTPVTINGGPSTGGGIPLISFATTENNKTISVTFTAHCTVSSPINTFIWVRFKVDGAYMLPKQTRLCAARGTTFGIGDDISTVTAFLHIPTAGSHELRVDAKLATSSLTTVNGWGSIGANTTIITE